MSSCRQPVLARFAADASTLVAAAGTTATVDTAARTITGLLVPFGKDGTTSAGTVRFSPGSITWHEDVSRVKLLVEHDQGRPVGYATELHETPEGIVGTFHVPEDPTDPTGDQVLAKAASRVRDGLSVGVQLDAATVSKLRKASVQGGTVDGRGVLRETSSVAVPAFDDSRVSAVAHTDLVVSAWADQHSTSSTTREDHPMPESTDTTAQASVTPEQMRDLRELLTAALGGTTDPAAGSTPPQATTPEVPPAAAPLATAGAAAAQVTDEAPVYTFGADGPSLVRDAYRARMHGDSEAAQRLERFNAQLTDGNPSSVMALAAVATTADTAALDPGNRVLSTRYRPDLMRQAINRGRPIIDRLNTITIKDATSFAIPSEGEFSGVQDHVEGTAHAPEGTLTMGDSMVSPKAVSGAYRISRELVDAYNPALDTIALRAMVRDYRRKSEGKAAALFNALAADVVNFNGKALSMRAELIAFAPEDDDIMPDFILAGRQALTALASDQVNGQPVLALSQAPGSIGTIRPGYTGLSVDGVNIGKASRLTPETIVMAEADAVVWAESAVQTFRYDEVEGPGIVKLALWAYNGGAISDRAGVRKLTTAGA